MCVDNHVCTTLEVQPRRRSFARCPTCLQLTVHLHTASCKVVCSMMVLGQALQPKRSWKSSLITRIWSIWRTPVPSVTSRSNTRRTMLVFWMRSNSLSMIWSIKHPLLAILSLKAQTMVQHSLIFGQLMPVSTRGGIQKTGIQASHLTTSSDSKEVRLALVALEKCAYSALLQLIAVLLLTHVRQSWWFKV